MTHTPEAFEHLLNELRELPRETEWVEFKVYESRLNCLNR